MQKILGMANIGEPGPEANVMKRRIISHMNNDHQESLIRYLEHYCGVSSFSARHAQLEDITFSALTVNSNGQNYSVPVEPPMTAWSDARPRVVAMDAEAVAGLGRSSITVKEYVKPYGFMLLVFIAAFLTFVNFSRRTNFRPGSLLYDHLLRHVPQFAEFCWRIQPAVIYPMILLHGYEAFYMARSRLSKHNVQVGSQLWLTWVCSTFIEGYGSMVRFDGLVKEEEARKATLKH